MNIKKIVAEDMRRALNRVREELGDEAVMLSSQRLDDGRVELVAYQAGAADGTSGAAPDDSLAGTGGSDFANVQRQALRDAIADPYQQAAGDRQMHSGGEALRETLAAMKRQTGASPGDAPWPEPKESSGNEQNRSEVGQMRSELDGIRSLLEQRLNAVAWDQFASRTPVQASIWERLNRMGVPGFLSKTLLDRLKPDNDIAQAWRYTLAYLNRAIPVAGDDPVRSGGVFALLGPTGAGKTTTIGKLATRYVLEHGADEVALVTTDSYRIAAHEQLRTLGRILGVTVRIVDHRYSLRETLAALTDKSLVLVDTAGLQARDQGLEEQLETLREQPDVEKLLVLPCTSQGQVLKSAWRTYSTVAPAGCILTRVDEAGALGEALALAIERQLPVVYETFGQGIPDDIRVAQAHRLVSRAVSLACAQDDEEGYRESLVQDFGGAWSTGHDGATMAGLG